jgi:hypothetical protein
MSSDLYDSEIDEVKYGSMSIAMNVHGTLFITTYDPGESGSDYGVFTIPNTADGKRDVEKIISAFQTWLEHVKETT